MNAFTEDIFECARRRRLELEIKRFKVLGRRRERNFNPEERENEMKKFLYWFECKCCLFQRRRRLGKELKMDKKY